MIATVACNDSMPVPSEDPEREIEAYVIGDPAESRYAISRVQLPRSEEIRLKVQLDRTPDGIPVYTPATELRLPELRDGEVVLLGLCRPQDSAVIDARIVALARQDTTEFLREIRRAWLADTVTERFMFVNPEGLTCGNEAYGAFD